MALLLAILLWAIVGLKDHTEDRVPARLVPLLADGMALDGPPPRVRVLVRGLGRELLKLHQSPPLIRWRLPATASEEVTLELLPSHVTLPPGVDAQVAEVEPRFVTLRVRRTSSSEPVTERTPSVPPRTTDDPAQAPAGVRTTAPPAAVSPPDLAVPRQDPRRPAAVQPDSAPRDSVTASALVPTPPDSQP